MGPLYVCLSVLFVCPVCNVGVLWQNGWMVKMKLGMRVGLGADHTVLDGVPAPPPQRGTAPIFSAYLLWPNGWWIKMLLNSEVGLDPSDIVLHGDSAPPLQKGGRAPPIFGPCLRWPNGWMDQDVTWYGGTPWPRWRCVGWGPSSTLKGAQPPVFGPCLLWPSSWMDEHTTLYGRPRPADHIVSVIDPAVPSPWQGHSSPPFWPMSIVATVAHLSCCWARVIIRFPHNSCNYCATTTSTVHSLLW